MAGGNFFLAVVCAIESVGSATVSRDDSANCAQQPTASSLLQASMSGRSTGMPSQPSKRESCGGGGCSQDVVRLHAARTALVTLQDVDRLEQELLIAEQSVASTHYMLERAPALDEPVKSLLETMVSALRWVVISNIASSDADLADVAAVDHHVSTMLEGQADKPLLAYYGPVQLALAQLRRLVARGLRTRLEQSVAEAVAHGVEASTADEARGPLVQEFDELTRWRQGDGKVWQEVRDGAVPKEFFTPQLDAVRLKPMRTLQAREALGLRPDGEPGVSSKAMDHLNQQALQYTANDHLFVHLTDFFDAPTWDAIVRETQRLWRSADIEVNCELDGKDRMGGYVLHRQGNESLYHLIYGNEQFRRWVSAVNGHGPLWPSDFPIELREYGRRSAGMECHRDLQMYSDSARDVEFAVTIENDSASKLTFTDAKGKQHVVHTQPNSVAMVRANSALHCVSSTEGGRRTILKFIYTGSYRKGPDFNSYTSKRRCGGSAVAEALSAKRIDLVKQG